MFGHTYGNKLILSFDEIDSIIQQGKEMGTYFYIYTGGEPLVIYKDTGVAGTSALIRFIDTGVTGLPITPSGADVTVRWHASGIFSVA